MKRDVNYQPSTRPERIEWMIRMLLDDTVTDWNTFTEWEQTFIGSVEETFKRSGDLSERQYDILEQLYSRA